MSTTVDSPQNDNPFQAAREYSPECVELMRAMSQHRKAAGSKQSSPREVLDILAGLGYQQPAHAQLDSNQETQRFLTAMTTWQQENNVAFPTCDHLLAVINSIGYSRPVEDTTVVSSGLPIDRRRHEPDEREDVSERRSSLDPSPQEQLELTDEENIVLDALKQLREETGREFASSEELLNIIWNLGYRPVGEDGLAVSWLDEQERCETQIRFTNAIEEKVAAADDGEFLTCRSLLAVVEHIGLIKD